MRSASATPRTHMIANTTETRESPDASASEADAPAAVSSTVTELKIVATRATTTAPPMYRAMFEIPDACPTWSSGTTSVDVDNDDAGPFARPSPAASSKSGTTKAAYVQDDSTNANTPTPAAPKPKPATIASLGPMRAASGVMNGVTAIKPAAAGRVATPVLSGLYPKVAESWK